MRRIGTPQRSLVKLAVVLTLLLGALGTAASASTVIPMVAHGDVVVNGQPAKGSTLVQAIRYCGTPLEATVVASTTTQADGGYVLEIPYSRTCSQEVYFRVEDIEAEESPEDWESGTYPLDLHITKAHLKTTIVEPAADKHFSTQQSFNVVAWVENTGQEIASNVTATLVVSPTASVQVGAPAVQQLGSVGTLGYLMATWPVTCTAPGKLDITVKPNGKTPDGRGGKTAIPSANLEKATVSVMQEEKAHLQATLSSDLIGGTASTEQVFYVTATIENKLVDVVDPARKAVAEDVTAVLTYTGGIEVLSEPAMPEDLSLAGGETYELVWEMECTEPGSVDFILTPDGIDENTKEPVLTDNVEPGFLSISQELKAHLTATIVSPAGGDVPVGQEYDVTVSLENSGQADAEDVSVTLDVVGNAELAEGESAIKELDRVAGDDSVDLVWTLVCTDTGDVTISVSPSGTDENTGEPIPEANLSGDSVTVSQKEAALEASITAPDPGEHYSSGQEFTVTATVENAGNADAEDVTLTIDITGDAQLAAGEMPEQEIGVLAAGATSAEVSWTLVCTGSGDVNITVTPAGTDTVSGLSIPEENLLAASIVVKQELKAHLVADISAPSEGQTYSTEQEFTVTATVENAGEANAEDVTLTLDITGNAALAAGESAQSVGTVAGGATSAEVSWTLVCTDTGDVTISVTPAGTDENTEAAIPSANLEDASVSVEQELKAHLSASVSAPGGAWVGDTFTVTATVENTGQAHAEDVSLTIAISGNAELAEGEIPTRPVGVVDGGTVGLPVSWDLVCTGPGDVTITVTPAGTDENTGQAIPSGNLEADSATVEQEIPPARLVVDISAPTEGDTISFGQEFEVTVTLENTGGADAVDVTATLEFTGNAELADGETEVKPVEDLAAGETSSEVSWTLVCNGEGDVDITVTPAGTDQETAEAIEPDYLFADSVVVTQEVFTLYVPLVAKNYAP